MRLHRIVGPGQARDAIQENDHITAALHETLRHLDHELGNLHVACRLFIERGAQDMRLRVTRHVRHFLGALINEQRNQVRLGMVCRDRVRDLLQKHGFAGAGSRDDKPTLPLAYRGEDIHDTHGNALGICFEIQALVRKERRKVLERNLGAGLLRLFVVDRRHAQQGEEAFFLLGLANLPLDQVSGTKRETPDL